MKPYIFKFNQVYNQSILNFYNFYLKKQNEHKRRRLLKRQDPKRIICIQDLHQKIGHLHLDYRLSDL
jgi:hypothetical protein